MDSDSGEIPTSFQFDREVNVTGSPLRDDDRGNISALREAYMKEISEKQYPSAVVEAMSTDESLHRYLKARNGNLQKALKMVTRTTEWRSEQRPDLYRAADYETEALTGKVRHGGIDRHGRPILVLDNTVENTKSVTKQLQHLWWNMDRLVPKMTGDVQKHCVLIHLEAFSLWNSPPMSSTKQTMETMSVFYAERLGNCILWQPPAYFHVFLALVKPFIDKKTMSKVVMIRGDASPGTKNDATMNDLIGPNWREQTGATMNRVEPKSSPGFDIKTYWPTVLAEECAANKGTQDSTKKFTML
eukprot:m.172516 g.172516  ORF g.172516 m.172516 type:complete len:301 (+) comp18288_c0_seq1:184-1086(+)